MPTCQTCGNDHDKAFTVRTHRGEEMTFDSVECMAHSMAPTCDHCSVRILGHGLEANGSIFCCDHCAEQAGVRGLRDRVTADEA